jgi:transposase
VSKVTELEKDLWKQNQQLTKTVEELTQTIEVLNQKIAELTERLNKNSRNSSKPPSTDGLAKPSPKSLRKPSGKKAGGHKDHKGTNFCVTDKPDQVIPHMPCSCEGCPHYEECKAKAHTVEKRHVVDMVIKTEVVTHEALEVECPLCRETKAGRVP